MYNTIIVGKGPAGISAAIYLSRAGKKVVVIGKDSGSLTNAEYIENYYGFAKPVKALKLFNDGIAQANRLGVKIISDEITEIQTEKTIKANTLTQSFEAQTLLFATGKKKNIPAIEGIKQFEGTGVSYCAVCDGFFYKNKDVAVIGGGKYALSEAEYLKNIAKNVKIFTNGNTGLDNYGIDIVEDKIIRIYGDNKVRGVETAGGKFAADGVFIAVGSAGAADFAAKLGLETDKGNIVVDREFNTNIPAVFAAGDCTGGILQIAKAVYEGAAAAYSIIRYLKKNYQKAQ